MHPRRRRGDRRGDRLGPDRREAVPLELVKLTSIESGLNDLQARAKASATDAAAEAARRRDDVAKRVAAAKAEVESSRTEVKDWVAERAAETRETVSALQASHEVKKLGHRADHADRYAAAAAMLAVAAVDEAELAGLDAWLARADANEAVLAI